jgi:putative transposase
MPKHTRPIISAQLREAVLQVAREHIPLGINGRDLNDEGVWEILMYASVNQLTIESACQELEQAPSGNTVREHLSEALDDRRRKVVKLEEQLNAALAGQLPRRMRRRLQTLRFEIAIDLHDVPYHGQPELSEEEVRRGPAKSGTTHFHSYATLAIVHDQCRYELALTFVWADETLAEVVERLIRLVKRLKLRLRRAYLDKAFCAREVFAVLRAHRWPYIIPVPLRGKQDENGVYQGGIGQLFTGRRSYYTRYTFNAGKPEAYTTDVVIVRTYSRGRYGRHQAAWFAYAVYGVKPIPPNQIFDLYRRRFGIESGYRQVEQLRARTASSSPALRLLLMGLALLLLNVYLTLRQVWLTVRRYGSRVRRIWLTLRRLALLLSRLLEQAFGIIPIEQVLGAEVIS